jgi:hypothetical protein
MGNMKTLLKTLSVFAKTLKNGRGSRVNVMIRSFILFINAPTLERPP